ncbi:MAG: glycosyltransferase family 4 protein [Azovibrio sp.]
MLKKLRVAIVNQHPADMLGGSEIQCDIISRELSMRGHEVDYVAVGGRPEKDYGVSYKVYPVSRHPDAIARQVLLLQPDLVYWRFNKHCFFQAVKKIHRADIPLVFSVSHVRDISRYYFQPGAWSTWGFRTWRRAVKEAWRLYREHRGFTCIDALVSNNPDHLGQVSVPLQVHIPNSMISTAKPFEWPRPYCVWVANIKERKQPEKYVELAARLQKTGVDFLMIGQVQSRSYEALLASGTDNFHYLGEKSLEEVNGILANSLFLIHTCHPEGFSNNFIQAWLQGRTVVSLAFDPGGLLVTRNLGLYAKNDMEVFVSQVQQLIDNPELANSMGSEARSYAENHFMPQRNVERLESVFFQILASRIDKNSSLSTK